jgi:hypothetical protein
MESNTVGEILRGDFGQPRCRRAQRLPGGEEAVRQAFAEIWEIWEVFRLEESEIRDLGDSIV